MRRERGARPSISRSLAHGLVGWGCLLSIAAGIVVTRLHTAEAGRAPLPPVPVTLSSAGYHQWKSFPDYHKMVPVLMYHSIGGVVAAGAGMARPPRGKPAAGPAGPTTDPTA